MVRGSNPQATRYCLDRMRRALERRASECSMASCRGIGVRSICTRNCEMFVRSSSLAATFLLNCAIAWSRSSGSPTLASTSAPLMARNTSIASNAKRLLPSLNGWFFTSLAYIATACSKSVSP